MTQIIPHPHYPLATHQKEWHRIRRLLCDGHYQSVISLIEEARLQAETDDAITVTLFDALSELCKLCQQFQQETDWHHQAIHSTQQREQTLKEQSITLLDRIERTARTTIEYEVEYDVKYKTERPVQSRIGGDLGVFESTGSPPDTQSHHSEEASLPAPSTSNRPIDELGKQLKKVYRDFCHLWQESYESLADSESPQHESVQEPDNNGLLLELDQFFDQPAAPNSQTDSGLYHYSPSFFAGNSTTGGSSGQEPPAVPDSAGDDSGAPVLHVYCLGSFRVYQDDQPVEPWPSSKGLSVFKYLVTHRKQPVFKEILMDLFWPDAEPESARNNLNVALHGLRKALRTGRPEFEHLLFENDQYFLNPQLEIWLDVDEFDALSAAGARQQQAGTVEAAMDAYRAAVPLYCGEFLADDRYVDWLLPRRQQLQNAYMHMLQELCRFYLECGKYEICIHLAQRLLDVDLCCEEAHRSIMRCYARQGQRHLALRQYHHCVETLSIELDIEPDEPTQALYEEIRQQ